MRHRIDVLSEQPESRVRSAKMEADDLRDVTTGIAPDRLEVVVGLQIPVKPGQIGWIPLLTVVRHRLAVQDQDTVSVLRELEIHVITGEVLKALL